MFKVLFQPLDRDDEEDTDLPLFFEGGERERGDLERLRLLDRRLEGDFLLEFGDFDPPPPPPLRTGDLDLLRTGDLDLLRGGGDLDNLRLVGGERNLRGGGDLDLKRLRMGGGRGGGDLRLNLGGERLRGDRRLIGGGGDPPRGPPIPPPPPRGRGFTGCTSCTLTSWPSSHPPFMYLRAFSALAGSM